VTHSLQEVAELTGRSQAVLRKHIERGKLRATKDGSRTTISDDDLDRYLAADELDKTSHALTTTDDLTPLSTLLARLPPKIQQAILDGMPSGKKQGSPEPFKKAVADLRGDTLPVAGADADDPHQGHPRGFAHSSAPRWKRTGPSTWTLGKRTFSWNGFGWEGGQDAEGTELEEGISPANGQPDLRP
jgi:excisionase family DNA binding protein